MFVPSRSEIIVCADRGTGMIPLIIRGARTRLTVETLGPISDDFDSLTT
jgi:hypothetical protein